MAKAATPVVLVPNGTPVTPTNKRGVPVTIVASDVLVLEAGASFETDDGGTVTIDAISGGQVTAATYTPAP